jgi:hypothetical protein
VVEARLVEERDQEVSYLEELAERLAPSGVTIHRAALHGNVAEALAQFVDEQQIDVVAMTTHGRGGHPAGVAGQHHRCHGAPVPCPAAAHAAVRRDPGDPAHE